MRSEPTKLRLSIVSLLDSVVALTLATSVTGIALKGISAAAFGSIISGLGALLDVLAMERVARPATATGAAGGVVIDSTIESDASAGQEASIGLPALAARAASEKNLCSTCCLL